MIAITRSAPPPALSASRAKNAYGISAVALALWTMQHGKCCYCEIPIPSAGLGSHVEHHRPKATYDELRNTWTNLLLACPQCNGHKSDAFPTIVDNDDVHGRVPLMLDPADPAEDPEGHITFVVDDARREEGFAEVQDDSQRGRATIETTGIDGIFYIDQRRDHLHHLRLAHLTFLRELRDAEKSGRIEGARLAYDNLAAYTAAPERHAAVARAFLAFKCVDERFRDIEARVAAGTTPG